MQRDEGIMPSDGLEFIGKYNHIALPHLLLFTQQPAPLSEDIALLFALGVQHRELSRFLLRSLLRDGPSGVAHEKLDEVRAILAEEAEYAEVISRHEIVHPGFHSVFDANDYAFHQFDYWGKCLFPRNGNPLFPQHCIEPKHFLPFTDYSHLYPGGVASMIHQQVMDDRTINLSTLNLTANHLFVIEDRMDELEDPQAPVMRKIAEFFRAQNESQDPSRSLTWELVRNYEFLTQDNLLELHHLAQDYSWEWAMASFDWNPEGRPTLIESFQAAVDNSPWVYRRATEAI